MTPAKKQKALDAIAAEIECCRICKRDKIGMAVPGEGNPDADIIFIGEAPGKTEAASGRPFIGRAGKLLRALIAEAGIADDRFFITSPVKYLPKHVTPTPAEIKHGRKHLLEQIAVIQPRYVVLLGNVAAVAMLDRKVNIGTAHGTTLAENGFNYFFSYHPAAPLHNPNLRSTLARDFKKLKKFLNGKRA